MTMTERDVDRMLEPFFAEARGQSPEPSPDLLARVLADAAAVQVAAAAAQRPAAWAGRRGPSWRGLLDLLGGWGGLGGLAAAGVTGLWIGVTGTGALGDASGALWGGRALAAETGFGADELLSLALVLEDGT